MQTFFWHDYETWGADPSIDRPSQFAGVRTDLELNIIDEPVVHYCQPPPDVLPHPEACLVTGITPQLASEKGLLEYQFAQAIFDELARPGTCGAGYNSIRFDDEVSRYLFYRNFYDPYEREWRNGNSRWDIIDVVRLCYALRPDGIEWPFVDGKPSFKLENLSIANNITHINAHDAYSDVVATIEMAKLIREKQPKLYDYCFKHRSKVEAGSLIDLNNNKPLLHISSKFSSTNGCAALVAPVAMHPTNKNAVIAFDLAGDPGVLEEFDVDEIRHRLFTPSNELPEGVERVPLKSIHLNKCPILVTPKLLDKTIAARLNLDIETNEKNWQKLLKLNVAEKITSVFDDENFAPRKDPERQLYNGFINNRDKSTFAHIRDASAEDLKERTFYFDDNRLSEVFFRYRARNFPQSLSGDEEKQWQEFVAERLQHGDEACLSIAELRLRIENLKKSDTSHDDSKILQALDNYAAELVLPSGP